MRLIATSFLALLLPTACSAQDPNEAAITQRLTNLAGDKAIACGTVRVTQDPAAAWRCAKSSDISQKPFWLAIEEHPTDSAVWQIITRTGTGKRYVIFYTSNNYGQPQFDPYFGEYECAEQFYFFPGEMFTLRCGPDVP